MSNAGQIGSFAGLVIGAAAAALLTPATFGTSAYLYALSVGASIGATEGEATVLPQFPCPPGMGRLLSPLLELPFVLGGRDPERGGLDCAGLVLYAYREGLGIPLEETATGDICLESGRQHLRVVWVQRGTAPGAWLHKLRPWDILVWFDAAANAALRGAGPASVYYHVGLGINREALVSSTLHSGVAFHRGSELAATYGTAVLCLLRPRGIGPWHPAQERALILR